MNEQHMKQQMLTQAELLRYLVTNMTPEQARWRPAADRWSVLEVVKHLADEEQADFREHLDMILHRPQAGWSEIQPMK